MFLIVLHHFFVHGVFGQSAGNIVITNNVKINILVSDFLSMGGKIGVDIFVMITGYFMIKTSFKLKSLVSLMLQTWFYGFLISMILVLFHVESISKIEILRTLFPNLASEYWFVSAYIALYLLIPFLNKLIVSLSEHQYLYLLGVLILLNFIIANVPENLFGSNVGRFVTLYIIGAYIRTHQDYLIRLIHLPFKLALTGIMLGTLSILSIFVLGIKMDSYSILLDSSHFVINDPSIPCLLIALAIFLIAISRKPWENRTINSLAGASFAVYLISDQSGMRKFLWLSLFKPAESLTWTPAAFAVFAVSVSLLVFCVCLMVEKLRQLVFPIEKLAIPLADTVGKNSKRMLAALLDR